MLDTVENAILEATYLAIANGKTVLQVARALGETRHGLHQRLTRDDERRERYARARDAGFDAIAEDLWEIANNALLDPKDRRVRIDAGLKLLARWCPQRYGEAVLLRHEAVNAEENMTAEEIAAALADMLGYPRGQPGDPVPASKMLIEG